MLDKVEEAPQRQQPRASTDQALQSIEEEDPPTPGEAPRFDV